MEWVACLKQPQTHENPKLELSRVGASLDSSGPKGIDMLDNRKEWYHSFVYGDPYREYRMDVLSQWASLQPAEGNAWACSGDFNEIVHKSEKKGGGRPVRESDTSRFQKWLDVCSLTDIGFKGPQFTWYNEREGDLSIASRLDRVVGNSFWRIEFDAAQVLHEKLLGTDHRPLILDIDLVKRWKFRGFHFEFKWFEASNWNRVLNMAWNSWQGTGDLNDFNHKLQNCASVLCEWHKREMGNIRDRIESLKNNIDKLQEAPMSASDKLMETQWLNELNQCWKMEEIFWMQRSRLNWLK